MLCVFNKFGMIIFFKDISQARVKVEEAKMQLVCFIDLCFVVHHKL